MPEGQVLLYIGAINYWSLMDPPLGKAESRQSTTLYSVG